MDKQEVYMGLFDKMREPVVLKEDSSAKEQIEQLNSFLQTAPSEMRSQIEQDIRLLQYGIYGEDALMFELKNSHLPMYIMHDLFFELNGLKAQIDYLIVTRKIVFIIECKNLYGNITIDNNGNFTRELMMGKYYRKEGIYSPITQNQRHLDMIREIRRSSKPALLRSFFDSGFNDNYKSIVVLANTKSILKMKYAPNEIKEKVVKVDGLISYIKKLNDLNDRIVYSDKEMKELADFFLEKSVPNNQDYTEKYKSHFALVNNDEEVNKEAPNSEETNTAEANREDTQAAPDSETVLPQTVNIEDTPVYQALKSYRYEKSREEGIKPYYIYNNAQLEDIIRVAPKSLEELKTISGFGDVKCQKYGNDIINILSENINK